MPVSRVSGVYCTRDMFYNSDSGGEVADYALSWAESHTRDASLATAS
jgi:hypothetical protein